MTFQATLSGHVDTDTTEAGNAAARDVEQRIFDAIAVIVDEANAAGTVVHAVRFDGSWVQEVITPDVAPAPVEVDEDAAAEAEALDATADPAAGDPGADDAAASEPTPAPAEATPPVQ